MNRRPLSHSKSLGMGETLVVGPFDKELMGKEAAIDKLERAPFEQAMMIKELEADLEILKMEAEEEEDTGIFNVKA